MSETVAGFNLTSERLFLSSFGRQISRSKIAGSADPSEALPDDSSSSSSTNSSMSGL